MTYYAFITNGIIDGKGECPCEGDNTFSVEITEEIYNNFDRYLWDGSNVVLNPNYEQEQAQKRQVKFEAEFFSTSLGWIRRKVTMKNGSTKDFLSDLLPSIMEGLRLGIAPNIITYREPDFTQEVTDWTVYQVKKEATQQFIQDCLLQISEDFGAI